MILASQLLVTPGIPLPSKPLPSVASHFPKCQPRSEKCLSRIFIATLPVRLPSLLGSPPPAGSSERRIFLHLLKGVFTATRAPWETKTLRRSSSTTTHSLRRSITRKKWRRMSSVPPSTTRSRSKSRHPTRMWPPSRRPSSYSSS